MRREVTTDFGRRCAYENILTNHLVTDQSTLACWTLQTGLSGLQVKIIWTSSIPAESIWVSYRKYLGEPRPPIDAHFHIFTAAEANEFRNILYLGLISRFDVPGRARRQTFVSMLRKMNTLTLPGMRERIGSRP